jgi:hypothetical protein
VDYKVKRSFYLGDDYHITGTIIPDIPKETGDKLIDLGVAEGIPGKAEKPSEPPKPPKPKK